MKPRKMTKDKKNILKYEMRMTRRRKLKEQNKSFYEIICQI